jgi:Protein of unknown function (DUF3575)
MLSFYSLLLGSSTLLITPDTTRTAPARQMLKLGVHGFETETVALTYERQLAEQWSVLGSVGYYGYTFRGNTVFFDDYGTPINTVFMQQTRYYSASAQLRHYFRSRRLRPLTGWFVAGNLQFVQQTSRGRYTSYPQQNYSFSGNSARLQLLLGRQWALGRRLTLDSYLGVSLRRRVSATVGYGQGVLVEGGLGLQVGYRFRPLPR